MKRFKKLSTEMYEKAAKEQQAKGENASEDAGDKPKDEKVVDAEFEDVSENKDKKE